MSLSEILNETPSLTLFEKIQTKINEALKIIIEKIPEEILEVFRQIKKISNITQKFVSIILVGMLILNTAGISLADDSKIISKSPQEQAKIISNNLWGSNVYENENKLNESLLQHYLDSLFEQQITKFFEQFEIKKLDFVNEESGEIDLEKFRVFLLINIEIILGQTQEDSLSLTDLIIELLEQDMSKNLEELITENFNLYLTKKNPEYMEQLKSEIEGLGSCTVDFFHEGEHFGSGTVIEQINKKNKNEYLVLASSHQFQRYKSLAAIRQTSVV